MSYKIVETIERGKKVLSVVPVNWEELGNLKWPRKNYEQLKLDPNSKPDDTWLSMPCKVKRKKLLSYDKAEKEISIMSDVTDTELEEELCVPTLMSDKIFDFNDVATTSIMNQDPDFNVEELDPPSYITQEPTATINIQECPSAHIVDESRDLNLQNIYFVADNTTTGIRNESRMNIEILSQKIDNLTKISNEIQKNQQNIMQKLASVTTTIEEYMMKMTRKECSTSTFEAISNVQKLQEFEHSLKNNPEFRNEVLNKLSIICQKGKGRSINNAYMLVDVMFTRKLMTECSWAGGTRNNNPKTCFKSYIYTRNLFFDIIYNTDSNFTKDECDNFFKKVLRHSVARNASLQLRCSAAKNRSRKIETKNCQKNESIAGEGTSSKPTVSPINLSIGQSADDIDKENFEPVD